MKKQPGETTQHGSGQTAPPQPGASCAHVPEFTRLNYFHGLLLNAQDLQTEQNYFREKLKLHNRCLHGYGTVCGLKVVPGPADPECDPHSAGARMEIEAELAELEMKIKQAGESGKLENSGELRAKTEALRRELEQLPQTSHWQHNPTLVEIECGVAIDCEGNELVIRRPLMIDLWQELSADDRRRVNDEGQTLYLSICYCPLPVEPVRPVLLDPCGANTECVYGKVRDAVRATVRIDPPSTDERCETCCTPCQEHRLLLARIDGFKRGRPLSAEQIDNHVRRMIGTYPFVTITGISWSHGAEYTPHEARDILGANDPNGGLAIRFSRPVLSETIARGVADLWVVEGGRGRSGNIYHMASEYVDLQSPTTTWLRFRQTTGESLQEGDRVLIMVRTCFILDPCCRQVDGNHAGGRVPILPGYEENERAGNYAACAHPPSGFGPWASGSGTPGDTFESWFYIKSPSSEAKSDQRQHDQRRYQ